jgi:hypothetical protein
MNARQFSGRVVKARQTKCGDALPRRGRHMKAKDEQHE